MALKSTAGELFVPVVYGNVATPLINSSTGHTHKWTVYLRSGVGKDLSPFISKVTFKLHESFTKPNRTLTSPPYEVTESGWGEFEVQIKVHLNDPSEQPIMMHHFLKLYESHSPEKVASPERVQSETYDEIVFPSPTPQMLPILEANCIDAKRKAAKDYDEEEKSQITAIHTAKAKIADSIQMLVDKDREIEKTHTAMKEELQILEKAQSAGIKTGKR
eukprot:m.339535 g.339535  ORF g.339535 m.339535 type:complete len:218 (-) comp18854_c0_seq1:56-709(-)